MTVTIGLENLLQMGPATLKGRRFGLITNHTGVDRYAHQNIDLLLSEKFHLAALFGPEHGVRGGAQAGAHVSDDVDPWTGLPTFSLYGQTRKPTPEMLQGIEALVFDIWDIGVRYYTYPYTMAYTMQAAKEHNIPFYVLDRPNPIGGEALEGNILEPAYSSFVGLYPIATRHGMTLGELAHLFNDEFGIGCDLTVIPCGGWDRSMLWDETGQPFVPASPNAPSLDMAVLYAGTCLFEGTNWSEGRGTTKPFELLGAPWVDGKDLATYMADLDLPGVLFRPAFFTPTFSKHQGEECQGVQIHVIDPRACQPVLTGLMLLEAAFKLYPEKTEFRAPYNPGGRSSIELLSGTAAVKETITSGGSIRTLYNSWAESLAQFDELRQKYLLY